MMKVTPTPFENALHYFERYRLNPVVILVLLFMKQAAFFSAESSRCLALIFREKENKRKVNLRHS